MNLSDTQTVLLSAAAARDDLSILPVPEGVKARGAALDKALAALLRNGMAMERPSARDEACWRTETDGRRVAIVVTPAGLAAIGIEPGDASDLPAPEATEPHPVTEQVRPGGKLGKRLDAVSTGAGATLDELSDAAGWQPHTTRAALTRLRQRGFPIALSAESGRKVYRLTASE